MALTQVDQSMIVQPVVTYGPAFAVYLNTTQTVSSGVAANTFVPGSANTFFMGFLARPA